MIFEWSDLMRSKKAIIYSSRIWHIEKPKKDKSNIFMFKINAYFILCFHLCLKHKWALFFPLFFLYGGQLNHREANWSDREVCLEHAQFICCCMQNDSSNKKGGKFGVNFKWKSFKWHLCNSFSVRIWAR